MSGPFSNSPDEGIDDMTSLSVLSEEAILKNIEVRYHREQIYSYVGDILVAVNPYGAIKGLYGLDAVGQYDGVPIGELPPHIFAIGNATYYSLSRTMKNQCIVISGESGAGKTESTKLIIQNFTSLSSSRSLIQDQILEATPILEIFGNAKTVRNDNSSRFGKFIEIQFGTDGSIQGAKILDYLLERSRIINQAPNERNYHVFYGLFSGLTEQEKAKYQLDQPQSFRYLNQSGCHTVEKIHDKEDFNKMRAALKLLNFGEAQESILTVLATILHIGNLKFQKDGQDSIRISNPEILDIIVEFLGLDREQTRQSLITRQIQILGEKATITPLTIPQAVDGQDALAKALYGRMFSWILKKINETICQDKPLPFVGVLDIFGFEDFETNSFEQFCINFANESLQLHFNQFIFKQEQEEYKKEGISWENISFLDNQPCIDLISQKPLGLLPLLDEESNFPKGTDLSLLEKINKTHATNPYFEKIKVAQSAFCIKHYAGKVTYNINGFLDKNRDTLRAEWMTALMSSKNKFVSLLFTAEEVKEDDGAFKTLSRGGGGGRRGGTKVPTIGAQFHTSLTGLVTLLTSCNPYFVRCIKPNTNKLPNQFDRDLVLSQLRYVGLLETVRVRKSGFSVRIPYKDFVTRYGFLVPSAKDADMQSRSTQILQRYSTNPADSAIGKTKVFMKNHVENIIEAERGKKLIRAALQIQKTCKMHLAKTKYKKKKTAVVEMQKVARGFLARKSYKQNYARVIVLQSVIRGWRQRKAYKKMVEEEKERKRREEEEARRRAEEARKKAEKAKKKAEEEKRKRKELERLKKEQAEAEARAKAQAEAEAKAKAETEARIKAEAEARSKAKAEAEALNKAKAEEELKAMEKAREEAEAKSKAIQKAKEESEAQAKAMAAEAEKAEQAVEEAKVEEATAAAEAAEAVALSQNPKKSVIFLSRKQIDELVGYIENLPLHTVPFGEVSTFIPTALDYPLLRQGELSTDDPNFALLIETLTQSGSPAAEGIIKALGQSVESNTFEKFAKVYFNDDSNCFYSAESIHQALLNTVCNDTLLTAKAVRLFYLTNFYIEYADGLTDTFVHRILNYMIEQVGPFPALHDELLSQMCKQTLKNPNQNKSFRAWRLLSILIGIIPPSLKLLPCILNYIVDQAPLDLTARLQYRLWRSVTTGARTKKITSIEFEALKKRVPVILQVDFFDETSTNFEVDTATTSRDSMKILLEAKGLSNRAGYSLYGVYQDTEIHFGENEKVLDIISTLEALAGTSISPEDPTKKPTTNKEFQEPTQENDGGAFQSLEQEPHQIPESEQKLVRALFSFNPTKAGEIPLNRNDIIILYEKTNSEWWKGKSKSTGAFGFFPAMYVAENLPEPPPPLEGEAAAHTVVGNVDGKLFKRKSLGAKDVQLDAPSLNYLVEPLDEKNQRVTINIEKNGKELGIVLRASKKRGCVVSKVDSGGLGSLSGIKEDDQIVSVDDRPIEGLKLEKVLKMIRATENKITFRIVRRLPKPEAAPPPPKTSPPPPVRTTSLWNKAGDYYYPWKLVVKKDFVNPVTKLDDPSDVALVTAQIMASEKGKADKPRFKQLKSSNEVAEILDIAMDWPLYFSRKFACVANKLKVDTFAFDYLGCYLLLGKEVVKFCDFDAVHIESSSKEKLTLKIDAELLELQIHNGTAVGEELQTHMKQLLQVARYSIAKRDHVVKDFNMLSFKQGDIIQIVDRADSSDWLLGSFGDKTGWVPSECVRLLYGKPSAFRKDKLKEDEKEEHVQATAAPDFAEFQKKVGECLLTYAKSHFRIDDGADTRSFSTGTMKGTLKRFASSGTKLPEHMLQSKDKDPAETEKEMSVKIKFTFEPIKSPLHKFITSSSDTKAAIEAFSLIMSYMGDYPSKKNRETIVQNLVLFALKSPPMYDEIYCQVVKQLTHNTSERMASIKRGWDLLAICLGCFPPTTILIPYITEFVTLHKDNPGYQFQSNAKECYERLERSKTRTEAFRISPPSLAEVLAIETGTPMSVNIVFPGNVVRNVKVDSFATAADVVNRIAGKVQAINADHYGLFILPGHRISGSDAVPVSNKMAILDVLSLAESVVKEFRPSSEDQPTETKPKKFSKSRSKTKLAGFGMTASDSGNSPSLSYNLVCRKKIWTKEEEFLDSDFVTNILFSQVMEDYLNGNLISMTELHPDFAEVAAQLAALQMKCSQNVGADHFVLHKLVPQVVYQLKDEAWWRDKVPGFFRELKEQPEVIFKRQVLKILQNLPLFGSILYSAKSSPDSRLPNGAVICFSIDGVHILDRLTKLPVISCGYNALIEYRFDTSEFMMNTGDLMNKSRLVVHTKEGSQICNTLDTYIEYLVKKRKVEQKKMQAANQSSSRPSLKKYSPW